MPPKAHYMSKWRTHLYNLLLPCLKLVFVPQIPASTNPWVYVYCLPVCSVEVTVDTPVRAGSSPPKESAKVAAEAPCAQIIEELTSLSANQAALVAHLKEKYTADDRLSAQKGDHPLCTFPSGAQQVQPDLRTTMSALQ